MAAELAPAGARGYKIPGVQVPEVRVAVDRETFAKRQAEMTQRWFEGVQRSAADLDAYIAGRHRAYLDRWHEALRFIPQGAKVLDLGGGNAFPELLTKLKNHNIDYWYSDVDPSAVAGTRALAGQMGFREEQFTEGFNDKLAYGDGSFNAVFSSHCIEHSYDLNATFSEIHRVLADGGVLLMAVPLGWEENPEHPYFFGPTEWLTLIEDAGFDVRVGQIGHEYPELGHDLFVAARKARKTMPGQRIDVPAYTKTNYTFIAPDGEQVRSTVEPSDIEVGRVRFCRGGDWQISIDVKGASEVLPIFVRHSWSGVVNLSCSSGSVDHDLHSWFNFVQPIRWVNVLKGGFLTIRPKTKSDASWENQAIFVGALAR